LRSAADGDEGKIIWRDLCDECFPAGTRVAMADGTWRAIERIRSGDLVLTRPQDAPGASPLAACVTQTFTRTADRLVLVRLRDQQGGQSVIRCTPEHPVWLLGSGWSAAQDLPMGGRVAGMAEPLTVEGVEDEAVPAAVFNFEVEGTHTYFVASPRGPPTPVWVHNQCTKEEAIIYLRRPEMAPFVRFLVGKADDAPIRAADLDAVYKRMVKAKEAVLGVEKGLGPDFWTLPVNVRADVAEVLFAMNLERNIPVIDAWDAVRRKAVSLKTLNLSSPRYANPAILDGQIRRYIDSLADLTSNSGSTKYTVINARIRGAARPFDIYESDIVLKELLLVIPAGAEMPAGQMAILDSLRKYAAGKKVNLIVTAVP